MRCLCTNWMYSVCKSYYIFNIFWTIIHKDVCDIDNNFKEKNWIHIYMVQNFCQKRCNVLKSYFVENNTIFFLIYYMIHNPCIFKTQLVLEMCSQFRPLYLHILLNCLFIKYLFKIVWIESIFAISSLPISDLI